jgi:hypothetical protein
VAPGGTVTQRPTRSKIRVRRILLALWSDHRAGHLATVAVVFGANNAPLTVALVELVNTGRDAIISGLPEEMGLFELDRGLMPGMAALRSD